MVTVSVPSVALAVRGDRKDEACITTTRAVVVSHSEREEFIARQKAEYVRCVWLLAQDKHMTEKQAAHEVAADTSRFSALMKEGRKHESLLGEGVCYRNFRLWRSKLGSVAGTKRPNVDAWRELLPAYRGAREYTRPGDPVFWSAVAKLYENENRLSMRYAYTLAESALRSKISDIPTYSAVHHWYTNHADQKAVFIAREGEEAFKNQVGSFIRREAPDVDEVWFSDHHIFDAAIKVWDKENTCWRAVRPWITAWLDWGSLDFVGWMIRDIYPNRDSIERSLRSGIVRNGNVAPAHIYIDNGRDYQASGFAKLRPQDEQRLKTLAELLGAAPHFAIKYNARAKVIERMFRTVCEHFSKLWPSYRGSNPQERPEGADDAWANPEKLPTLDEFAQAFEKWLLAIYRNEPSHGETLKGLSPAQARATKPHFGRDPLDALALHKAFLREIPDTRTVHRGGVIRVFNRFYQSEALWLVLRHEKEVRVKLDPDNLANAYVFTQDGREIGLATEIRNLPGMVDENQPETVEALREGMKKMRREIKQAKATSALHRGLGAWRKGDPGAGARMLAPAPGSIQNRKPIAHEQAPATTVSVHDLADFEAALRESTRANKDRIFGRETDHTSEEDAALLDALDKEEAASLHKG